MREHGTYEMHTHGQVISIKVCGGWNYETTLRWCIEYKDRIDEISQKPWARVMDLTHWALTTPDVWERVDEVNNWANGHNQKYEIVICPLSVQKQLLDRAHQVLSHVEIVFCNSIDEAYRWLTERGMNINHRYT